MPLKAQAPDSLERLLAEVAEGVLKEFEKDKATGFRVLWSLQKDEILEDLKGWLEAERVEEGDRRGGPIPRWEPRRRWG